LGHFILPILEMAWTILSLTPTLPNPMSIYKSNENKHPTTLAAIMTSVTKEKRDYEYMAR
jgi:hypothetical protein